MFTTLLPRFLSQAFSRYLFVRTQIFSTLPIAKTRALFLLAVTSWAVIFSSISHAQNVTATVAAGTTPNAIAINPTSNKIYVVNTGSGNVSVIDGNTNSVSTIGAGTNPTALAINSITNRIYVTNSSSNNVTVINGATNATTTVNVGTLPDRKSVV